MNVIVTGGASGMGAACVRRFVAQGDAVVLVDRNEELAASVAAECAQAGGSVVPVVGDVADSSFCDAVVSETERRLGRVDVLVNAAGIIVRANGASTTDAQWFNIMNVNVSGTFFFCRAAINSMLRTGGGAIVNFGSIWGDLGSTGAAAYCASKGAVHNLTRALALDHAKDNIRINAVCPGEVNTPMLRSERAEPLTDAVLEKLAGSVPMGRLAAPEEIANVVRFLASAEASYMTGSLVLVDAGFAAR